MAFQRLVRSPLIEKCSNPEGRAAKALGMAGTIHLFEQLPLVARPEPASEAPAAAPARRLPLVGVIRNPRSHRSGGSYPECTAVATLLVEAPARRGDLQAILARFAEQRIDLLVVDGGDGTVRDVLTCGSGVFGESWPPLIVLPSGKTNALAVDLGLPADWSLDEALRIAGEGGTVLRRPLVISQRDNEDARVLGFAMGAGLYTAAIGLGQEAHRKGAFNAVAVGVTTGWTILRALFGRGDDDALRRATRMRLHDDAGHPLPHSCLGPEDERYLLFASTMERFPAGLKPFRHVSGVLRMALMDVAKARLLLRIPLIVGGLLRPGAARRGYHLLAIDSFEVDLGDRFILDGEAFPAGHYRVATGPKLRFVAP